MAVKLIAFLVVIFAVFRESHLQLSKMGVCPQDVKPQPDFKASDFKGTWYEIKRYPTTMIMGKCVSIDYKDSGNGSRIISSQIMPGLTSTTSASGLADFARYRGKSSSTPGMWTYKMTLGLLSSNASFIIAGTDYKNWAVMYSCADFFNYSSLQFAWIYSRARELSATNLDAALEVFKKQNIDPMALIMTDQKDCVVEKPKKQ